MNRLAISQWSPAGENDGPGDVSDNLLLGLAAVITLGTVAQWLAWRLKLPSILLLLVFGFVAGPITGFLNPDELLGDLLFPLVSLSVAVILFEGALGLNFREIREVRKPVRRLISIGALVTWVLSSLAAYYILSLPVETAVLLGALVIVSGPTVVGPLLRHVRPVSRPNSVLKWEGILIDPIGVIVAVLVFEAIIARDLTSPGSGSIVMFLETVASGSVLGLIGAAVIVLPMRRYWIPDFLQNAVTLTVVVSVFALANSLRHESGLLAVVLMGVALANQRWVSIHHIIEFKENLRSLLLGTLFILLAARLTTDNLQQMIGLESLLFLGLLILVVRPLSVAISTIGSKLTWRERALVAWMMPRGIVAAAAASTFALGMQEAGFERGGELIPYTFMVIIGTVAIYGITAAPVARWLGVARPTPQGVLIIGAHRWAREIASTLMDANVKVLLADTNRSNVRAARLAGLPAYYGSVLTENALDELNLDGIGRVVAMTPNNEVNALVLLRLSEVFDRVELYQIPPPEGRLQERETQVTPHLRGRYLVGSNMSFRRISEMFDAGAEVRKTDLTEEFGVGRFFEVYGTTATPLFLIDPDGKITVFTSDLVPRPEAGDSVISIVSEKKEVRQNGRPKRRARAESERSAQAPARIPSSPQESQVNPGDQD